MPIYPSSHIQRGSGCNKTEWRGMVNIFAPRSFSSEDYAMLVRIILIPFKILAAVVKLLVRVILAPIRVAVSSCLLQAGIFLLFMAIVGVLVYFVYQWLT